MSLDEFDYDTMEIYDRSHGRQTKIKVQGMLRKRLARSTQNFNEIWNGWRKSRGRIQEISDGSPQAEDYQLDHSKVAYSVCLQMTSILLASLCVFYGAWPLGLLTFVLLGLLNLVLLLRGR